MGNIDHKEQVHTYVRKCVYQCTCICMSYYTYVCVHTLHRWARAMPTRLRCVYVCVYWIRVYTYVCTGYAYIRIEYVMPSMLRCVYVCVYWILLRCVYVYWYIRMYVLDTPIYVFNTDEQVHKYAYV
jgi:hypothetical protein